LRPASAEPRVGSMRVKLGVTGKGMTFGHRKRGETPFPKKYLSQGGRPWQRMPFQVILYRSIKAPLRESTKNRRTGIDRKRTAIPDCAERLEPDPSLSSIGSKQGRRQYGYSLEKRSTKWGQLKRFTMGGKAGSKNSLLRLGD